MKAEKVLGVVACAVACVASVNAFADQLTWFDGNVGSTTTSGISTPTRASWNNDPSLPTGVTLAEGSITLDNDSSTALVLTPAASSEPTLSDQVVTISSTAVLTPSDATDLGDVDGAKAGFAVGVSNNGADTNFYGYASGLASGSRWVKLSGTVPQGENASTTFSIVLDYRTGKKNVKFYVSGAQLTAFGDATTKTWSIGDAASLDSVSAYGTGSLTALSATCEKAVAAVGDVKYGSAAEAVIAAGTSGTVLDINPNTGEATSTKQATNGLYAWQCDVLGIATDAAIPLQPATKEVASDKIAVAVSSYTPVDGVSVKFQVKQGDATLSGEYAPDAIGIPMTTGQYTVVPTITAAPAN